MATRFILHVQYSQTLMMQLPSDDAAKILVDTNLSKCLDESVHSKYYTIEPYIFIVFVVML